MRRFIVATLTAAVLAIAPGAFGKPILGLTGSPGRFHAQTGQVTTVRQAFLGWGQGQSYGAPFSVLLPSLGPVPMLHLGTLARGNASVALRPAQIASGAGDAYLGALNQAVSAWGRGIYIRPLGEMNNAGNPWSGTPAAYRAAFARIYLIVHGAPGVASKLARLHQPAYRGPALAPNPFPRVRVLWSPLAGGGDPKPYWPGNGFVDVGGADIYREAGSDPPWAKFNALFGFVRGHGKPFLVPEWGLLGVDDATFVSHMCAFLKSHRTEAALFYAGKPGSDLDLGTKPRSRAVYGSCITQQAGQLPSWARGGPGSSRQLALKLISDPAAGRAPLGVSFSIAAKLSSPIAEWQIAYGDGETSSGRGPPPTKLTHVYARRGSYEAALVVFQSPPFTPAAIRFLATTTVTVGDGTSPLAVTPMPASGRHPLAVSFRIRASLPRPARGWQLVYGDGLVHSRTGRPPRFAGHTYGRRGSYRVLLIVDERGHGRVVATSVVTVQ